VGNDLRVVYVGGLGRSGSTLLEQLLAGLPGTCAAGEVVHLWQRGIATGELCGCGQPFGRCDFWSQVGRVAFGGWHRVSLDRLAELRDSVDRTRHIPVLAGPRLPARMTASLAEYGDYYLRVYQAIAEVSGRATIIDSSKHASLAFCLRRIPGIDLRVIHLVRDSRAVAFSWASRVARPEGGAASYMTTWSPASTAAHWNAQNGALQVLARRGTRVHRVRYEDLAEFPAPTIRKLARFGGLPSGDADLAFLNATDDGIVTPAAHTVSGNPMRFTSGRLVIRRDDRWRTAMPQSGRRAVTALTLPLLAHYGYDWRQHG
jgi:Sulfotransferase family